MNGCSAGDHAARFHKRQLWLTLMDLACLLSLALLIRLFGETQIPNNHINEFQYFEGVIVHCTTSSFTTVFNNGGKGKGREVVCGQVWWPILGICPLHLTHPSAHTQQWTHTRSSGARGAVGGSVPCSRVSPQSWYWRWREHLLFTPPTDNPCRTWESNLQPLGYKSNSLTIRPRLPPQPVA